MRVPDFSGTPSCSQGSAIKNHYCGGCAVVPVPLGLLPLGAVPILLELPLLLPPQVSEIMSTLATLKVFSEPAAPPDEEETPAPAVAPLSQVPLTETSWPT